MENLFVNRVRLNKDNVDNSKYPFNIKPKTNYNVATDISNNSNLVYTTYGGEDLHSCSHGESFLKLIKYRFWDKGLYILDEPEAALSPQRQMTLLCYIHDLAKNDHSL